MFTDSLTLNESNYVDLVHSQDEGFEHCTFLTLYLSVQSRVSKGYYVALEPQKRAGPSSTLKGSVMQLDLISLIR